jgi:hypothetical protein
MTLIAHDSAWLASLSVPQLHAELELAASRLACLHLSEAREGWPAMCRECGARHPEDLLHIPHREGCRTGNVARVLYALASSEVLQAFDSHITPRKETDAQNGNSTQQTREQVASIFRALSAPNGAAAQETRPRAIPFLVQCNALPGLYAEPWGMDEDGAVHDADGHTIAEPVGCDLVEPDDIRAMRRIVACVNYCDGIDTAQLTRAAMQIGGAM